MTSQRMTLHKVRASRLAKLKLFQMKVGNFKYVDRELGLGDLKGNLFTLTLRGIEGGTEETVTRAVNELKLSGVINYFGLQRFGTHAIGTHEIGAALLRGAWGKCTISSSDREMGTTEMPLLLASSTRKPVMPPPL